MELIIKDLDFTNGHVQVSSDGQVKSKNGEWSKGFFNGEFYEIDIKFVNGLNREVIQTYLVHNLLAYAFFGNNACERVINHKNWDKLDNRIYNLEICY